MVFFIWHVVDRYGDFDWMREIKYPLRGETATQGAFEEGSVRNIYKQSINKNLSQILRMSRMTVS